jgi:hypothetical protein
MPSKTPKRLIKPLQEGLEFKDGKFWKYCPDCGAPQSYKRRDHALQMLRRNSVCNSCGAKKRGARHTGQHRGVSVSYFELKKADAIARGYCFEITIDDVADLLEEQMYQCALTGEPIALDKCSGSSGSLDRIDNSKGYTVDNIQITTKDINMLRGSFSVERFIELCRKVAVLDT